MQGGKPQHAPPANGRGGLDPSMLSGAGVGQSLAKPGTSMVKLESGPITAIQVALPRTLAHVKAQALEEVGMMGDSFFYKWTVKDKNAKSGVGTIQGMSIQGAMVLYRNWTNCSYTIETYDESPRDWTFLATFVDWEKGVTFPRLFRQRKAQNAGEGMNAERQMDIAFQIGQSKAIRNAIANAMPDWLLQEAMTVAETAGVNKCQDVPRSIFTMLEAAKAQGVTKEELWKKVGKTFRLYQGEDKKWRVDPETWLPKDIAEIMALFRAIDERQTTVDIEFRDEAPKTTSDEPTGTDVAPAGPATTAAANVESTGEAPPAPASPAPPVAPPAPAPPATPVTPAPTPAQVAKPAPAAAPKNGRKPPSQPSTPPMREPGED